MCPVVWFLAVEMEFGKRVALRNAGLAACLSQTARKISVCVCVYIFSEQSDTKTLRQLVCFPHLSLLRELFFYLKVSSPICTPVMFVINCT